MKSALRIIIIEDNPDDSLLVTREVEHAGFVVQAQRAQTAEELRGTLAQGTWDVVLADYSLPHFSATEGLAILKETGLDVPFIIVSGCIGEEVAVQLIKDGAAGYVMKDHLSLLGPAVQRELRDAGERHRKRDVERSLAESEERYRVLVESQTDLLVKTGPNRRFGYANPTYCALFGKSLQELTNSSYEPAIHPDDLSIVADATDRLFHPPYSCRYEARAMTVGGWRWIEWNARAEVDNQGTVVALIGSGRDITERKQIEEKLRMSEFDLRQAQAVAHVGSWRWDIAHDEFVWSDEMRRIFGIAPHAFTGSVQDVIARAIHPDDRALIEESNRAIIEDHNPQPLEYRIVWPDGSVHTVWVEPGEMTLDDKGHVSSLTGVVLDITQRKQAEERLAHEGDLLRLTGEMAHVGGWEFNVATGEGTWTDEVARIHGLDPAALTNAGLGVSFYVDESRARIEPAIKQAVEHGTPYDLELEIRAANGEHKWVRTRGVPVQKQGKTVQLRGTFQDITERKRAEDKLRVAQLQWSQFLEASPDPMWTKDASGRYVAASKSYLHFDPSPAGNIIGKTDAECFPPEKATMYVADDRIAIEKGVSEGEVTAVGDDGKLRTFLTKKVILRTSDGSVAGTLGVSRDITDRKQAEEENQRERAFFDRLVETAPEGIAITGAQGKVLRVNAEFLHMFGYGVDEAIGQCIDDLVAPPAREEEVRAITRSTSQGGENLLETVRRRKDGTLVDVSLIVAPIVIAGKQEAVCAIYRDITERKQADEALKESENRFRAIFDQAAVGVALLNTRTGHYVRINQKYCDLVGYTMQEMLQKSFMDITLDQDIQENVDKDAQLMEGKSREFSFEKRYVHKDGHLVWGNLTISPLWKSGEKPQTYFHIAIVENITGRKQAEAQLRQSQKMEAIGELAGGVAHDFNNLLTGILGNIALIRSTLSPADPLLENLDAAETAARQAAYLTKGLLTFSRSAVVLPVPINIADALDATLVLLKQSLPASMEIVRDYEQTAWNVLVDQSQMTQILLNLAVNARDAMKGKGILTIRTSNEVVEEDYVQTHPFARTGEFVHLSVTDTGPGIPPEILEHLFEPFHTTKPVGSGTGLGLSIVYGAVKQAGGWITAGSTEGVGTTFDIYLPRCLEEPVQPITPSSLPVNADSGTVLVVEDEPIVCAVAQALLSRSGYTVLTAPDGASALNVLREHPVSIGLILLDMTMPGMTTSEIVQAIRALDPTVPILLNSGYTSNGAVKQMVEEGSVQGFLGKPYELQELLSTIDQLMKRT